MITRTPTKKKKKKKKKKSKKKKNGGVKENRTQAVSTQVSLALSNLYPLS